MERRGFTIRLVATQANARQPSRAITDSITVLGSGPGCDIILASSKVDEAHAVIVRSGAAVYLCDLGARGGITLNQRRIRWARMSNGDIVTVGPFSFRFEIEGASEAPPADSAPFSLRNDKTIGLVKSVDPVLVIGSDYGCDVVLSDPAIHPRHCIVAATQEGTILRDLLRRRSIRRNGRRINSEYLSSADVISVGRFELTFESMVDAMSQAPPSSEWVVADEKSRPPETAPAYTGDLLLAAEFVAGTAVSEPDESAGPLVEARAEKTSDEELEMTGSGAIEMEKPTNGRPVETKASVGEPEDLVGRIRSAKLDHREHVIKARIAAAQNALEMRAKKLNEDMERERKRLKVIERDLQTKAQRILHVAREKQTELEAREGQRTVEEVALREEMESLQNEVVTRSIAGQRPSSESADAEQEPVPFPGGLERVFGGEFEPAANTAINSDATDRLVTVPSGGAVAGASAAALQEQAAGLVEQVRLERMEMEKVETGLEGLRFEVERLGSVIARGREKQETQQSQLEARLQSLRAGRQEMIQEREELTARLRQLDAKETALRARMQEADRARVDLEQEGRRLAKLQEDYEQRRRDLRAGLEAERHRLQLRQSEMQRKAWDLIKGAREKRRAIESEVAAHRAEIERRELELRAQRAALEDVGRSELHKTTTELEQVLGTRLSEIESEVFRRQAELDLRMDSLTKSNSATFQPRRAPEPMGDRTPNLSLEDLAALARLESGAAAGDTGRLEILQQEVETLRQAIKRIDEDDVAPPSDPAEQLVNLESRRSRLESQKRLASLLKARLAENTGKIRDGSVAAEDCDPVMAPDCPA